MAGNKVLRTRLCDILGIEYPIMLAGMGTCSGPTLAAAVSNAGGLGVLGASGLSPEEVRGWIEKTKRLTDKPFGLDLILPHELSDSMPLPENLKSLLPAEHVAFVERLMGELELEPVEPTDFWSRISMDVVQEVVRTCLDEGVALFASGLGNPGWIVPEARRRGMRVTGCVGNTKNAVRLKEAGVDFVVAQGYDGGGHTGRVGTMSLIPQAVDAVAPLPVVGAGGIMDGRGLAAALALGAEGVWVGTAFLATREANVDAFDLGSMFVSPLWAEVWNRRMLEADDEGTVVSKISTGKTARHIKNRLIDIWDRSGLGYLPMPLQGFLIWDLYVSISKSGRSDLVVPMAGQGVGLVKEIRSAADVLRDMVEGAIEILSGKSPAGIV
ncbi:MAG: nitronate monooxygenase family protein [Proteobacteria bacterium]|nr:nitronate monooxygenase family protein [Pseudomonadota bacterium]